MLDAASAAAGVEQLEDDDNSSASQLLGRIVQQAQVRLMQT